MFAPLSRSLKQQLSTQHLQLRHASFSLPSLKSLFPSRAAKDADDAAVPSTSTAAPETEAGKGLFDLAQESEAVIGRPEARGREKKKATFVSRRELAHEAHEGQ